MAAAAAIAAASTAFSSLHFTSLARRNFWTIKSSLAPSQPSPPSINFNISFATKSKKSLQPKPLPEDEESPVEDSSTGPLFIPWIVRDENGNLTLQSTPPARWLQAMANAKTTEAKKKKKKNGEPTKAAEPKHSKAARRFYNENFRDPPQRLSKVLAAAGGKSFFYYCKFRTEKWKYFGGPEPSAHFSRTAAFWPVNSIKEQYYSTEIPNFVSADFYL